MVGRRWSIKASGKTVLACHSSNTNSRARVSLHDEVANVERRADAWPYASCQNNH
jgi:hypothetical protein